MACFQMITVYSLCLLYAALNVGARPARLMHMQSIIATHVQPSLGALKSFSGEPHAQHNCDHFVLHFRPSTNMNAAVTHISTKLGQEVEYIPQNTLRVFACEAELHGLNLTGLLWINQVPAEHKESYSLSSKWQTLERSGDNATAPVLLTVRTAVSKDLLKRWTASRKLDGVVIKPVNDRKYIFEVDHAMVKSVVETLTLQPEVKWVERRPTISTQNSNGCTLLQSEEFGKHPIWERGLDGSGELAHIGDTGLDYDSCFFRDDAQPVVFYPETNPSHRKVLSYQEMVSADGSRDHTDPFSAHGTHVAGSVAGNSLWGNTQYNGMAPKAKIFFTDLADASQSLFLPPDFDLYFRPALVTGAGVSSNSWGSNAETNDYVDTDRETDMFAYDNQGFLIVVASGNTGHRGLLSPGSAKNALSVGSTGDDQRSHNDISSFSGYGPAWDGRVKPEVVAPGQNIWSARSDGRLNSNQCDVTPKSGTSMAAPLVAGATLIVRQYFTQGWYPSGTPTPADSLKPSAALLKGMIIHSAEPVTGGFGRSSRLKGTLPEDPQGWGFVRIDRILRLPESSFRLHVENNITLHHRQHWHKCFKVDGGRLKATMNWIDAVAAFGVSRTVVNDLDLTVDDGTRQVRANLHTDDFDNNNIIEVLEVKDAQPGTQYKVNVYARHVPVSFAAGQPFALVLTGSGLEPSECPTTCGKCVHGTCVNGECVCEPFFHHVDCSLCDEDTLCNGHGKCNEEHLHKCECDPHFVRKDCSACDWGWYGPNCDSDCLCNLGSCDYKTGLCTCPDDSWHGHYGGPKCERCAFDWTGASCKQPSHWCKNHGEVTLMDQSGVIQVTGEAKYTTNMQCTWKIIAPPNSIIYLTFVYISTERDFDTIMIWDSLARDYHHPVAKFSGQHENIKVTIPTGIAIVYFDSDITNTDRGFTATYVVVTVNPSPLPSPPATPDPSPSPVAAPPNSPSPTFPDAEPSISPNPLPQPPDSSPEDGTAPPFPPSPAAQPGTQLPSSSSPEDRPELQFSPPLPSPAAAVPTSSPTPPESSSAPSSSSPEVPAGGSPPIPPDEPELPEFIESPLPDAQPPTELPNVPIADTESPSPLAPDTSGPDSESPSKSPDVPVVPTPDPSPSQLGDISSTSSPRLGPLALILSGDRAALAIAGGVLCVVVLGVLFGIRELLHRHRTARYVSAEPDDVPMLQMEEGGR